MMALADMLPCHRRNRELEHELEQARRRRDEEMAARRQLAGQATDLARVARQRVVDSGILEDLRHMRDMMRRGR